MKTESLILRGVEGLVEGEVFPLSYGQTVILGRSRNCDISLKKSRKYQTLTEEQKKNDTDFLSVSRRHTKISFYNSQSIEIEDMSANGTYVNGEKVSKKVIGDIKEKSYELRLGTREKFKLEWGQVELELPHAADQAVPVAQPLAPPAPAPPPAAG
ncbi:MAG: FHA domain-containing protein [Planctomycetota bacterium]